LVVCSVGGILSWTPFRPNWKTTRVDITPVIILQLGDERKRRESRRDESSHPIRFQGVLESHVNSRTWFRLSEVVYIMSDPARTRTRNEMQLKRRLLEATEGLVLS
jgi:hypothetical protein